MKPAIKVHTFKFDTDAVNERTRIINEVGTCPKCGVQLESTAFTGTMWTKDNPKAKFTHYACHCPTISVDAKGMPEGNVQNQIGAHVVERDGHFYQVSETPAIKPRKVYFWLAINGASCTMSPYALPASLTVTPTPELLIGFETRGAAEDSRSLILTQPIAAVRAHIRHLIATEMFIRPDPNGIQPPTTSTVWSL